MKPSLQLDVRHSGNLGTERRTMTLDENSVAHLMGVLTDLYSDTELAVIRETATNALDSHKAARNPAPIKVYLPTCLNPTFTVVDEGVGMSADDVLNNYSKYGYSSKRDNDDEAGMLGLGCKAPLTYTSQFSLCCVKNGMEINVLVSRGTDGVGGVEIVDAAPARVLRRRPNPLGRGRRSYWKYKPNGVTVKIPVRDPRTFTVKAHNFFKYWEKGSVLINDVELTPVKGIELDPSITLVPKESSYSRYKQEPDLIVQGGVAYPLNHNMAIFTTAGLSDHYAVIRVPIGSVDFTPNREELHYTPRTKEVCAEAHAFVQERVHQLAQAEVDACPNGFTAAKLVAEKWQSLSAPLTYQGVKLGWGVRAPEDAWLYTAHSDTASRVDPHGLFSFYDLAHSVFVVGHPTQTVTRKQREQTKKYVTNAGMKASTRLYFVKDLFWGWPWLDGAKTIPFKDIDAIEVPPPSTVEEQTTSKITLLIDGRRRLRPEENLDNAKRIILASPAWWKKEEQIGIWLDKAFPDQQIVVLSLGSWDKFKRAHPTAIDLDVAVISAATALAAKFTPMQKTVILDRYFYLKRFALIHKQVDDPALSMILKEIHDLEKDDAHNRWSSLMRLYDRVLPLIGLRQHRWPDLLKTSQKPPKIEYPLLQHLSSLTPASEAIEYVNAVYATRQKKGNKP